MRENFAQSARPRKSVFERAAEPVACKIYILCAGLRLQPVPPVTWPVLHKVFSDSTLRTRMHVLNNRNRQNLRIVVPDLLV